MMRRESIITIAGVALLLTSDPKSISGAMAVGHLVAMFLEGWDADSAAGALPKRLREADPRVHGVGRLLP